MKQPTNPHASQAVYRVSLVISVLIAVWGIASSKTFESAANALMAFIKQNLSWLYLIAMLLFVVFCVAVAFSRYGNIRLGPDDSRPEHSTASWFAMLFGAGMGIGLIFWGISEPLSHFAAPPAGIEAGSVEAANFAVRASFMHWGFHPWANYAVIGMGLAYFQFRKNKPGLISSLFIPILGEERTRGPIGKAIDIFAVIATIAGVATSLGQGTMQINSGLSYLFGIPSNRFTWLAIIVVIAVIYIRTAITGVDKGIRLISDINLYLALALVLVAFLVGPTVNVLNIFTSGMGQYLQNFVADSLNIDPFGDNTWFNAWRIFYWAWWIAWAPFVGTFIARISKGRTVREFILGVIVAPSIASILWFAVFGGMGLNVADQLGLDTIRQMVTAPETALFQVFDLYPLGKILSIVTIVLLCTFFITSANSATFVLSMFSSDGDLNPPNRKKVVWGVVEAVVAFALLLSGGLGALQTASVAAAFPFVFIMLFACWSLIKAFRQETDSVPSGSEQPSLPEAAPTEK